MIEINTQMFSFKTDKISFEAAMRMIRDDFIHDDDYVEFVMEDECRAAIRKREIVAINEVKEVDA